MKFILIDSVNKEVKEVEVEKGLQAIYDVLGVSMIQTATYLPNGDCIYCDEEGLFGLNAGSMFFDIGAHQPFAGNGLVVGTNLNTGSTISAKSKVDDIKKLVKFKMVKKLVKFKTVFDIVRTI